MCDLDLERVIAETGRLEIEEDKNGLELELELESNPLIFSPVVRQLLKYIGAKELRNYRFVCKLWNEEAIIQMKKRSTFIFNYPNEITDFSPTGQQIEYFLRNGQHFIGFKNLKLKFLNWNPSDEENSLVQLLSANGEYLRRIELDFERAGKFTVEELRNLCLESFQIQNLKYLKLLRLPSALTHVCVHGDSLTLTTTSEDRPPIILHQLTTLEISVCSWHPTLIADQSAHRIQKDFFFKQLFRMCPNLNEFKWLKCCPFDRDEGMEECIHALLAASPQRMKLIHIHNECRFPSSLLKDLTFMIVNIQELVFNSLFSFRVNFSSNLSGNQIKIQPNQEFGYKWYSEVPPETMIDYIQHRLSLCRNGISCTGLLRVFLSAFEERNRAGFNAVVEPDN